MLRDFLADRDPHALGIEDLQPVEHGLTGFHRVAPGELLEPVRNRIRLHARIHRIRNVHVRHGNFGRHD